MRAMAFRLTKALAAIAFVGGLAAGAQAQSPAFRLESVQGSPGETAQVRLFLSGGVNNTAAINFTITVPAEDVAFLSGNITGDKSAALVGFTYEENSPTVASGREYRAVLYPNTGSSATFDSTAEVEVARISVPISASADPTASNPAINLVIKNQFDTDGITGLVGISNAAGVSIVSGAETPSAGGTRSIAKTDGAVTVVIFGGTDNFKDAAGIFPGWEARQVLPFVLKTGGVPQLLLPTVDPLFAAGDVNLNITQNASGVAVTTDELTNPTNFGFVVSDPNSRKDSPGVDALGVAKWFVSTNVSNPNDNGKIRLRANTDSFAQADIFQEARANVAEQGESTVPVSADGIVGLTQVFNAPASASNGLFADRDGFEFAFDVQTDNVPDFFVKLGSQGQSYTIDRFELTSVSKASLTNEATIYSATFAGGDAAGFTAGPNIIVGNPINANSTDGLALVPGPHANPSDVFGFRWWERNISEWTVATGKLYRVDFVVASSAVNPVESIVARARFDVSEIVGVPDYVKEVVIESAGFGADGTELPSPTGSTYTTYLVIPDILAGRTVSVFFDAYKTLPSSNGGVTFKSIIVRSYDRPAGL